MLRKTILFSKVSPSSKVADVKEQVAALLSIPVLEQKLLFKGKALQDEKQLKDYSIDDGCKLTVFVRKGAVGSKADITACASPVTKPAVEEKPVWAKLQKFLRRHYCEKDAQAVLAQFKKEFEMNLSSLSLDDIERLAISKLRQA